MVSKSYRPTYRASQTKKQNLLPRREENKERKKKEHPSPARIYIKIKKIYTIKDIGKT